ncbi:MAG: hypothetical protein WCP85_29785 [Mariniphaga sp.]
MDDNNTNNGSTQGNGNSDKAEDPITTEKTFADKAEDLLQEAVFKVKASETFGSVLNFIKKAEDFIEEKAEEFQSGEMGAKIEGLKDQTEAQADEIIRKVKEAGQKIGDRVEGTIDALKGKKDQQKNENGAGI